MSSKTEPLGGLRLGLGYQRPRRTLDQFARGATLAFIVQGLGAALAYAVQAVIARSIGAHAFGVYAYATVWLGLIALGAGLGLPSAAVRFVPEYLAKSEDQQLWAFVSAARHVTVRVSTCVAAVGALIAVGLWLIANSTDFASAVAMMALIVPAYSGTTLSSEISRGFGRIGVALIPSLIARPVLTLLLFEAAQRCGAGPTAITALVALAVASYLVRGLQHVLEAKSPAATRPIPPKEQIRAWLRVAGPILASAIFTTLVLQGDILIVGSIRGPQDAGIYAVASKSAGVLALIVVAVNMSAAPRFSALAAKGDILSLQKFVGRTAHWNFWPSALLGGLMCFFATQILGIFGSEFESARPVLLLLIVGQVVNAAAGSVGAILSTTGFHREAARALGMSVFVVLSCVAGGTVAFGLTGAAAATAFGFAFWNCWFYGLVHKHLSIRASVFDALWQRFSNSASTPGSVV